MQYRANDQLELFFRSMRDTKHVANILQVPRVVDELMHQLGAPLRLVAHLTLVHDVACQMMARLDVTWPTLTYNRTAVRLGVALHDIGKIPHREKLIQPGHAHEVAGDELLRTRSYRDALAHCARTHRQQPDEPVPHP